VALNKKHYQEITIFMSLHPKELTTNPEVEVVLHFFYFPNLFLNFQ